MGKIISLVNQKGGVGKTTTSINLAASLGILGKKTLLVDVDPQGNATTGVGIEKGDLKVSLYDALIGAVEPSKSVKKTKFKNLDLIPSSMKLAGIEIEFVDKQHSDPTFSKGSQLKRVLYEREIISSCGGIPFLFLPQKKLAWYNCKDMKSKKDGFNCRVTTPKNL